MRTGPIGYAMAIGLLLTLLPLHTGAQIPQPALIPEGVPKAQRDELIQLRSVLDKQRTAIATKDRKWVFRRNKNPSQRELD